MRTDRILVREERGSEVEIENALILDPRLSHEAIVERGHTKLLT